MAETAEIQELVNEITNFVNSFTPDEAKFIELMSREHRTLQQSFTRLCLKWLEHIASDDYRTDDRNQGSHVTAKALIEAFNKQRGMDPSNYLPFI